MNERGGGEASVKAQRERKKHTHPVSDVNKTLLICQVKEEEEAHRISEEGCCQTTEPTETRPKHKWLLSLMENLLF